MKKLVEWVVEFVVCALEMPMGWLLVPVMILCAMDLVVLTILRHMEIKEWERRHK